MRCASIRTQTAQITSVLAEQQLQARRARKRLRDVGAGAGGRVPARPLAQPARQTRTTVRTMARVTSPPPRPPYCVVCVCCVCVWCVCCLLRLLCCLSSCPSPSLACSPLCLLPVLSLPYQVPQGAGPGQAGERPSNDTNQPQGLHTSTGAFTDITCLIPGLGSPRGGRGEPPPSYGERYCSCSRQPTRRTSTIPVENATAAVAGSSHGVHPPSLWRTLLQL